MTGDVTSRQIVPKSPACPEGLFLMDEMCIRDSLYEPQGLRELGESRPQKKCAVRGGQISHRERTQLVNPRCV